MGSIFAYPVSLLLSNIILKVFDLKSETSSFWQWLSRQLTIAAVFAVYIASTYFGHYLHFRYPSENSRDTSCTTFQISIISIAMKYILMVYNLTGAFSYEAVFLFIFFRITCLIFFFHFWWCFSEITTKFAFIQHFPIFQSQRMK